MRRRSTTLVLIACFVTLLALLLVGCSGAASGGASSSGGTTAGSGSTGGGTTTGGGSSAGATTITEQNFAFNPSTLTVKVGDTVTFTNQDAAGHNVKIDGKELGIQNQGESKTWTAAKAGTYPFSCVIHPSMTGQITVQ